MLLLMSVCFLASIGKSHLSKQHELSLENSFHERMLRNIRAPAWNPRSRSMSVPKQKGRVDRLRFLYMGLGKRAGTSDFRNRELFDRDPRFYNALEKLVLPERDLKSDKTLLFDLDNQRGKNPETKVNTNKMLHALYEADELARNAVQTPESYTGKIYANTYTLKGDDMLNVDYTDSDTKTTKENGAVNDRKKKWWALSRMRELRSPKRQKNTRATIDPVFYFLGLGK